MSRSHLMAFGLGIAAGAVAYATYPRWKHKVEPLLSAVAAGMSDAFRDAGAASEGASGPASSHQAHATPPGPMTAATRAGVDPRVAL